MGEEQQMIDICCVGHITKDKIITPQSTVYMNGGTSYYFAEAINCLPRKVSFSLVTSMNPDDADIISKLRDKDIDISFNISRETVYFENKYDTQGQRTQRVMAKADPFKKEHFLKNNARIYHLGTLLADDFPIDTIEYLASKARISIDAQGFLREVRGEKVYPAEWKDKQRILKNTYYLKVNEEEMLTITGTSDPRKAALLLADWGVKEVIITLGEQGSLLYIDGKFIEVPAYQPHAVVDATGCGDTFMAGYLWSRQQNIDPLQSGKIAAAMCTLKLEHSGTFNGTIEDIKAII